MTEADGDANVRRQVFVQHAAGFPRVDGAGLDFVFSRITVGVEQNLFDRRCAVTVLRKILAGQ